MLPLRYARLGSRLDLLELRYVVRASDVNMNRLPISEKTIKWFKVGPMPLSRSLGSAFESPSPD